MFRAKSGLGKSWLLMRVVPGAWSLEKFAFFVERRVHRVAVRGAIAVVAVALVFEHDGGGEGDQNHGDDKLQEPRERILNHAGENRAEREEEDEVARGLVIGLENPPALGHVVVIAEPGL